MGVAEIIFISVGLALDALAVSLCIGAARLATSARPIFRLAFHFGLFQALMPLLGWLAGHHLAETVEAWDHWIAFTLLAFVGGRMVHGGIRGEQESYQRDPTKGAVLILLSIAVSIDALAVGFSLAMLKVAIWLPSVIIGLITAALSLLGLLIGHRLGARFGKRTEIVGGVVLIGIGLKILLSHLAH